MTDRIDIVVLLDRSGSMQARRADHEGGLRSFVQDQAAMDGDVRLTFVRFDTQNPCDVAFEEKPIRDVRPEDIELVPRGGTPLLDAVGQTFSRFRPKLGPRVIAMVITDGEENESREWTKERVKQCVAECEAAGWKVLYLGANVDAFAEARNMGLTADAAVAYTVSTVGIGNLYGAVRSNVRALRGMCMSNVMGGQPSVSWNTAADALKFTDEQRRATMEEDSTIDPLKTTKPPEDPAP